MYDVLCPPTLYLLFMGPIVIICGDLLLLFVIKILKSLKILESFENWVISYSLDETPN